MAEFKAHFKSVQPDLGGSLPGKLVFGLPGEDGFSPIAKVTQTDDGAVITITDKNGTTEAVVKNGVATDEQVAAAIDARLADIISGVLEKIPVVGVVDTNNIITIYGDLKSGEYTLKYEHEDGTTTEIGSLTIVRDDAGEDEPGGNTPEKTLVSISAEYSGGSVPVGTAVSALTGIVVTATYNDGTTSPVTDYTLSGSIVEGNNTVTVTYKGMTATFIVVGVSVTDGDITKLTWESGGINVNGSLEDASGSAYYRTERISVTEVSELNVYVDSGLGGSSSVYVSFWNAEPESRDTFISRAEATIGTTTTITVPDTAMYARIRSTKNSSATLDNIGDHIYLVN